MPSCWPGEIPLIRAPKAFEEVAGVSVGRAVTRFAGETVNSGRAEGRIRRLSTRRKPAMQLMLRPSFGSSALVLANCVPLAARATSDASQPSWEWDFLC